MDIQMETLNSNNKPSQDQISLTIERNRLKGKETLEPNEFSQPRVTNTTKNIVNAMPLNTTYQNQPQIPT